MQLKRRMQNRIYAPINAPIVVLPSAILAAGRLAIEAIEKPEDVSEAMSAIKGLTHALTSERELKAALFERLKALGIVYSKESKTYEWAKQ